MTAFKKLSLKPSYAGVTRTVLLRKTFCRKGEHTRTIYSELSLEVNPGQDRGLSENDHITIEVH